MHQRKGQMKRKGEKKQKKLFCNCAFTERKVNVHLRLGQEDYSGGHGLQSTNTRRLNL